jgi:hypothetical protein
MATIDKKSPQFLQSALRKQAQGRGTTNSEKRAIYDYQRGRRGLDTQLPSAPLTMPSRASGKRIAIEDVENLQSKLRSTGGVTEEGDSVGVVQTDGKLVNVQKRSDAPTPSAYPTVLKVVNGTKSILLDATGITMTDTNTGKSFTIAFSALAQNVALRTDSYCDGTTTKSMLHVGSAPY